MIANRMGQSLLYFPLFAALVVSIMFFEHLSEKVPIHWNLRGEADREGSRLLFVAVFPVLQLIHLLSMSMTRPRNSLAVFRIRGPLFTGTILLVAQAAWFQAQSGFSPPETLFPIAFGGLLVIVGFFMSESKQNALYGVRTSWTLNDTRVWYETHKVAGPATMITGAFCALCGIFLQEAQALYATIGLTLVSAGLQLYYSYVVAKRLKG